MSDNTHLDKWDVLVSLSSGALTAAMDVLWVQELSFLDAHKWGVEKTNNSVLKIAKNRGYKGKDLAGAIAHLEKDAPIPADKLTNDFGGGLHHHLRDFSHHPTIVGLFFSILTQFTGNGYGTDKNGSFEVVPIKAWERKGFLESIFTGTVAWGLHMVSDMAGSSSSAAMGKEGTGLPGPILSFLKELSSIPGIRAIAGNEKDGRYDFSLSCQKLFNGTLLGGHDENGNIIKEEVVKFDFRTELGIAHESLESKQYIPVLFNEGIICGFYSVRRLLNEIKEKDIHSIEEIRKLEFKKFLPWKSSALKHMRMLASASFSAIDISAAGVKAALQSQNKGDFARVFLQNINVFGVMHLAVSASGELSLGLGKLYGAFSEIAAKQKERLNASPETKSALEAAKKAAPLVFAAAKYATPIGYVSGAIQVYQVMATSVKEYKIAREERIRIEAECRVQIEILQENRAQMELTVSEYMTEKLTGFSKAFDQMDTAVAENDTDGFLLGNSELQKQLGKEPQFQNQDEFDDLMSLDDDFKL